MKKILTIILLTLSFNMYAQTPQNILVYAGPGAGPKSVANTVAMLRDLTSDQYTVKTVSPEEIIDPAWIDNTVLLVIPGGADRPYLEKLRGQGNANIKRYVQNGGKFLGICAGAYYSADRIEFGKGDNELEVTGERELKFFPGLVEGPTYTGFDHRDTNSSAGMRAAKIHWQAEPPFTHEQFTIFYNGGGHFVNADKFNQVIILARYANEDPTPHNQPAAIVECTVGKGKAILSGPHFEWHADVLEVNNDDHMLQIKDDLKNNNVQRLKLARHLLQRLDLDLK